MQDARRSADGSAGDADYAVVGLGYTDHRRPDPRIAARVHAALGDARRVLNVGAGAGSYEPADRDVVAVEPSATMRAQRPPHLAPAVDATAEHLPFADGAFDAAMTTFSVHQWADPAAGLREVRRVTAGPVAVLTCDPALVRRFWLDDYAPAVLAAEARRYPAPDRLAAALGGTTTVEAVPIPLDCRDGFNEAYYGRPERLLDPSARRACSAWSQVPAAVAQESADAVRAALADGSWDAAHAALRTQPTYAGSLVLVVSRPS
jgi:SAM-dependent methyltransferase